jgi:hypothetical protein
MKHLGSENRQESIAHYADLEEIIQMVIARNGEKRRKPTLDGDTIFVPLT